MKEAKDPAKLVRIALSQSMTGYSCAKSVFTAYAKHLGLDCKDAFRIAGGFGGGLAFGEVCGAVAGAVMVIGLQHASPEGDPNDEYARSMTYEMTQRFMQQFKARIGSVCCRDLIGYDLSALEENQNVLGTDRNMFNSCPVYVQAAVEILETMEE